MGGDRQEPENLPVRIEGKTLRTWKVDPASDKILLSMATPGRPAHSDINLWHGPDYTPTTISVYLEDGSQYPIDIVMSPKGYGLDTIQVKNIAETDFPLTLSVGQNGADPIYAASETIVDKVDPIWVQGNGAIKSFPLAHETDRVQVLVEATEGKNAKFYIELLQGPNNIKQAVKFYASSGIKTPFYAVFTVPGNGYTVRIRNDYPVEFPVHAYVAPYTD